MNRGDVLVGTGLIAIMLFILLSSPGPLTGFLTFQPSTTVSVENDTSIKISYFQFDQIINRGNSTDIDVEITNSGSNTVENVNFTVRIFKNGTALWSYPSRQKTLEPGSFLSQSFMHTPQDTGLYRIRLRIDVENSIIVTGAPLQVNERPTDEATNRTVTLTRKKIEYIYPEAPEEEAPSRSWDLHVPENITLEDGKTSTSTIGVENTGEAPLENVRLLLQAPVNITTDYSPEILFSVSPNTTKNFMIEFTPDEGLHGEYDIGSTLHSKRFSQKSTIDADVRPASTLKNLQQEIKNLRLVLADARTRTEVASDRGSDVEKIEKLLDQANESLETASDSVDETDIEGARAAIDTARESLDRVYTLLFQLQGHQISVRAPLINPFYIFVAVLLIGIALLLVIGYYYLHEKHKQRPELLRGE